MGEHAAQTSKASRGREPTLRQSWLVFAAGASTERSLFREEGVGRRGGISRSTAGQRLLSSGPEAPI